jgi:hypothetical protein
MHARAVDDAATRLRHLRVEEWEDLALGAVALAVSIAATQGVQTLALPLFLGGLVVLVLGLRAMWRHWDLVDRLCDDPDAYVIPDVLERAERETTMRRRQSFAAQLRAWLRDPGPAREARVAAVADDLQALIADLENSDLRFDPGSAVACMRLLTDMQSSPLLNPELPADELRSRVFQIGRGLRRTSDVTLRKESDDATSSSGALRPSR